MGMNWEFLMGKWKESLLVEQTVERLEKHKVGKKVD
jgi:hypothetical protein